MEYKINLYGALSQFNQGQLIVTTPAVLTVAQIMNYISIELQNSNPTSANQIIEILDISAIADDDVILSREQIVHTKVVHVLPPVNGG